MLTYLIILVAIGILLLLQISSRIERIAMHLERVPQALQHPDESDEEHRASQSWC